MTNLIQIFVLGCHFLCAASFAARHHLPKSIFHFKNKSDIVDCFLIKGLISLYCAVGTERYRGPRSVLL